MDKLKNVLRGNEDQSNVDEERGKCVATQSKQYVIQACLFYTLEETLGEKDVAEYKRLKTEITNYWLFRKMAATLLILP